MDLKIEMLSHAGALGPRPTSYDDYDETDDDFERSVVEKSLVCFRDHESYDIAAHIASDLPLDHWGDVGEPFPPGGQPRRETVRLE